MDNGDNKELEGMTLVEERSLVVPRRVVAAANSVSLNGTVKNFKKFCKVTVIFWLKPNSTET